MRAAERRAEKAGNQLKPGDDARHSVGGGAKQAMKAIGRRAGLHDGLRVRGVVQYSPKHAPM
jgi:hypothetical protein